MVIARRGGRSGFTLVETLVALVILAIIAGAISGIFVASIKFLAASQSETDAVTRASLALQEAVREMENAVRLTEAAPDAVTFELPDVDNSDALRWYSLGTEWDPVFGLLRPEDPVRQVRITLSGDRISVSDPNAPGSERLHGSNITALSFSYNAELTRVTISVTAEGRSGQRVKQVTVQQTVAVSNRPGFGT